MPFPKVNKDLRPFNLLPIAPNICFDEKIKFNTVTASMYYIACNYSEYKIIKIKNKVL